MNLALHDAEVFAKAVTHHQTEGHDSSLLDGYSSTCLRHVWNYQAFAAWFTDLMHNAGDASYQGEFRRRIARAELERLFESDSANRLFSEFITGLNQAASCGYGRRCGVGDQGGGDAGVRGEASLKTDQESRSPAAAQPLA